MACSGLQWLVVACTSWQWLAVAGSGLQWLAVAGRGWHGLAVAAETNILPYYDSKKFYSLDSSLLFGTVTQILPSFNKCVLQKVLSNKVGPFDH